MTTKYGSVLPELFHWRDTHPDQGLELVCDARVVGKITRHGEGWIVAIDDIFHALGGTECVVGSRDLGQIWLTQWLRRRERPVLSIALSG